MTTISAREFNQQVSKARKLAASAPVFITERGQPKHVLLSIEAYEALTGSQRNIADLLALTDDLTDGYTDDLELELPQRRDLPRAAELD